MSSGTSSNKPRKNKAISLRLTQTLDQALQQCVSVTRKKRTQIATEALIEYLSDYLGAVDSPSRSSPPSTASVEDLQERVRLLEQEVETLRLMVSQSVTVSNFCITTLQIVLQNLEMRIDMNRSPTEARSSSAEAD